MTDFLKDPSFYFALIVFIGLTHQKRFFKPLKKSPHQYQQTMLWQLALIITILFFWEIFLPRNSWISFCCYPIIFYVFMIALVSVNIRRTLFTFHQLIEDIQNSERQIKFYTLAPALTSILAWIIALSLPFGFTFEAWHLNKYWDDYQAVVERTITLLEEDLDAPAYQLPLEYQYLTFDGTIGYEPIGFTGQQIYFHHDSYQGVGHNNSTLYCGELPCVPFNSQWLHPTECYPLLEPHWFRCTHALID